MLGAILGDRVGRYHEMKRGTSKTDSLLRRLGPYSDDTVLAVATMDRLLYGGRYGPVYRRYCLEDPDRDYGKRFMVWARSGRDEPYGSYGNGAAMRAGPIAFHARTLAQARRSARESACATHDHPAGVTGAEALVSAVFLVRSGHDCVPVMQWIEQEFGYPATARLETLQRIYGGDARAESTVPLALRCFAQSHDLESALSNVIATGGDMDTIGAMTGYLIEARYGLSPAQMMEAMMGLPPRYRRVVREFYSLFLHCEI